jgi:uncharacterized protein YbcI
VNQTKGRIEAEINDAIIKFEKEYMGHGPLESKTHILDDLIIVRLKGVMTKAELQLATARDNPRGRMLIKEVRQELVEKGRPLLETVIHAITGKKVVSLHTDISTITGERIIVFTLDAVPL